jgi:hypothetical protein
MHEFHREQGGICVFLIGPTTDTVSNGNCVESSEISIFAALNGQIFIRVLCLFFSLWDPSGSAVEFVRVF